MVDELIDITRAANSFDDFVRTYLVEMPGQVTRIMLYYHSDSYIRTNDLSWAAYDLFETLGAPTRLALVAAGAPPINRGTDIPAWSPTLRARVMEAESELVEQFEF